MPTTAETDEQPPPRRQRDGESPPNPKKRDYVHASLLYFNAPLFNLGALASIGFTPSYGLTFLQSTYLHAWYFLPPLWYTSDIGSYWVSDDSNKRKDDKKHRGETHKTITQILWRNIVNTSYMATVPTIASIVRGQINLEPYAPSVIANACIKSYNWMPETALRPFIVMTGLWTVSYVVHYVGFAWLGQLPDYLRRCWKRVVSSATNLAATREKRNKKE